MNFKSGKNTAEFQALVNDDTDSLGNESQFTGFDDVSNPKPVTFSPTSGHVEIPPYSNGGVQETGAPTWISTASCDKRTKWVAIAFAVVAVCVLIIVLGCVYMIHVHPTTHNDNQASTTDTCSRIKCKNGGTCVDGKSIFNCHCPRGYSGMLCEIDINDCISSPCMHGGTCRDKLNGFKCQCKNGYTGDLCQEDIDDCASEPCVNEGVCRDGIDSYGCQCLDGFTGVNCELDFNECGSNPCANGATCHNGNDEYKCQCPIGYTGTHCEKEINECSSSPCINGATCHDILNGYRCQCPDGVTGLHCDSEIDECWSNPCINGATCHDDKNSYTCMCAPGFTGTYCHADINECLSDPCTNGATCHNYQNAHYCQCAPGYTGRYCETDIDECRSSPCRNNGTCINNINGFSCLCDPQSTGPRCESGVNPLGRCPTGFVSYRPEARCYWIEEDKSKELTYQDAESMCMSKGSTLASFESSAEAQFVGKFFTWEGRYHITSAKRRSDSNLYWNTGDLLANTNSLWSSGEPSSSNDCVGAIMRDQNTKFYSMDCTLARPYVCERSIIFIAGINDCRSLPCLNGATCHNLTNAFRCECTPGFSGTFCEVDIDDCASSPCLNGATCNAYRGSYTCQCPVGYTGTNCETDIDDCQSNPCQNGATCVDGVNVFTCNCVGDYTGPLCDTGPNDTCYAGYVFYKPQVRCYFIEEDSIKELDPDDAQAFCEQKGGSLASLETPEEIQAVGAHYTWQGRYHIVGAKRRPDGDFYWFSGVRLPNDHPKWSSDEPYSSKDCVATIMRDNITKLYSMECYSARPFVCESGILYPPGTTDCRSMPCLNGATCVNVNTTYTCQCPVGFTGQNCETDIDECASSPCKNGATCRNSIGSFNCSCIPGFNGKTCENDIDECQSNPCHNESTCVDGLNQFTCVCAVNFTGITCKADMNADCPPDFLHDEEHARCYFVEEDSDNQLNYQDAREMCQSKGADLAVLETEDEVEFVGSKFTWTGRYHVIGARRDSSISSFYWVNGAFLSDSHRSWSSGEPGSGNCVSLIKSSSDNGSRYYTLDCTLARPYVCEADPS